MDYLYGKVFGSSNISDALNITTRSAQEYIKIMRELDIIEPVKGQGKGKYKFK